MMGDYSIVGMEQVSLDTYSHSDVKSLIYKETKVVFKVTYRSGKIKFITKTYRH